MGSDATSRETVPELSEIVQHPAGVRELHGVRKTYTHVVGQEVLVEKKKGVCCLPPPFCLPISYSALFP